MSRLNSIIKYAISYFKKLPAKYYLMALSCGIFAFIICLLLEKSINKKRQIIKDKKVEMFIQDTRRLKIEMNKLIVSKIILAVLIFYMIVVFSSTVLERRTSTSIKLNTDLFWSYKKVFTGSIDALLQNLFNMAMMVPIGFLLCPSLEYLNIVYTLLKDKDRNNIEDNESVSIMKFCGNEKKVVLFCRIVFMGFLFSLIIEFSQLFLRRGLCELDDLFNNTLGCIIGFLMYSLFQCFVKRRGNGVSEE